MKSLKWNLLWAICFTANALANPAPTDSDLKVAYCLKVVRARIQTSSNLPLHALDEKFTRLLEEQKHNEKRLQAYLLSKRGSIDVESLEIAASMADSDLNAAKNLPCYQKISNSDKTGQTLSGDYIDQCFNAIRELPASKRIGRCADLSWLPF